MMEIYKILLFIIFINYMSNDAYFVNFPSGKLPNNVIDDPLLFFSYVKIIFLEIKILKLRRIFLYKNINKMMHSQNGNLIDPRRFSEDEDYQKQSLLLIRKKSETVLSKEDFCKLFNQEKQNKKIIDYFLDIETSGTPYRKGFHAGYIKYKDNFSQIKAFSSEANEKDPDILKLIVKEKDFRIANLERLVANKEDTINSLNFTITKLSRENAFLKKNRKTITRQVNYQEGFVFKKAVVIDNVEYKVKSVYDRKGNESIIYKKPIQKKSNENIVAEAPAEVNKEPDLDTKLLPASESQPPFKRSEKIEIKKEVDQTQGQDSQQTLKDEQIDREAKKRIEGMLERLKNRKSPSSSSTVQTPIIEEVKPMDIKKENTTSEKRSVNIDTKSVTKFEEKAEAKPDHEAKAVCIMRKKYVPLHILDNIARYDTDIICKEGGYVLRKLLYATDADLRNIEYICLGNMTVKAGPRTLNALVKFSRKSLRPHLIKFQRDTINVNEKFDLILKLVKAMKYEKLITTLTSNFIMYSDHCNLWFYTTLRLD